MKNKIIYKNNLKLVEINDKKFILKEKNNKKKELFTYLKSKDFNNVLFPTEERDNYELYRYINDTLPLQDKGIELIFLMSMLHIKTTIFQEINIDKVKELYEETKHNINYLRSYYLDLQDFIETKIFMSPAEQLLVKNISKFYKALNYAEHKIDNWYNIKSNQQTERLVQLHNNLSLENVLKEEDTYFINWENSKKDLVIYDFLTFYQKNYLDIEMTSLFRLYQSKYKFTDDETLLFQSLIALPPKVTFDKTNYINTINVRKIVDYVDKTNTFLSEYYIEDKQSNNDKFTQ